MGGRGKVEGGWLLNPAAVLFERESLRRNSPPGRQARKRIAGTVTASIGRGCTGRDAEEGNIAYDVAPCLQGGDPGCELVGDSCGQDPVVAHAFVAAAAPPLSHSGPPYSGTGNERNECNAYVAHALKAEHDSSEDGTGRQNLVAGFKANAGARSGSIGYREGVAPTIGSEDGTNSRPFVQKDLAVRRIMPVECERLMGYTDGYTAIEYRGKPAKDGPRYKALGNSVAVNVMRWIGQRIKQVEKIGGNHAEIKQES